MFIKNEGLVLKLPSSNAHGMVSTDMTECIG